MSGNHKTIRREPFPRYGAFSRRQFLRASVAAPMLCSARHVLAEETKETNVKIASIEIFSVRYPTVGYFKFFQGPRGNYGRSAVLVKMTADDGTVGWGQSVPVSTWSYETLETATVVIRDYLIPTLIGRDPLDIRGAHQAMDRGLASSLTMGMPIARSGLDFALHDLGGKLTGRSVAQMWGKPPAGPIRLSWTLNPRTLDEVDQLIDTGWQRGYRDFNIKVAPDPKFDVELALRVKRRVPDGFLWADANGGYDPKTALEVAPKLADVGVDVLEAPIKPNHLSGYRALTKQGALPILMDEGIITPVELVEFIKLKMLDGVAMKPSRTGGLYWGKRQIEILLDAGLLWLGSGLCDPDISLAAHLALYGAYDLKRPAALNGPQFLAAEVLKHPIKIRDAMVELPSGCGLGVEVDEAKVLELVRTTQEAEDRSVD